jgi:hypothetical protein
VAERVSKLVYIALNCTRSPTSSQKYGPEYGRKRSTEGWCQLISRRLRSSDGAKPCRSKVGCTEVFAIALRRNDLDEIGPELLRVQEIRSGQEVTALLELNCPLRCDKPALWAAKLYRRP